MRPKIETRDNCHSCRQKLKRKFTFYRTFCNKRLHVTTDCTVFSEKTVKALTDLIKENITGNILHVCNERVNDNQADKIGKTEMKDKRTSKEIQNISEKLERFTSQLSKLFEAIEEMQQEVRKLKEPKTYAAATGQNNPGKRIVTSENKSLGIRIKGVPEPQGTAAGQISQDRQAVQSILDHLQVNGRIRKLLRVGHRRETATGKSAKPKESQNSTPEKTPCTVH